ncbi:hypothetical protein VdG1_09010 [Verticillium dahliae VDG1]|nr:hypothetical protein VdG1_09010 [Verticillium dahliae VDG1]
MFWRRREQPLRMSLWYAMNGFTAMFGSLMTWGLARIPSTLRPYQVIFLFFGLVTGPVIAALCVAPIAGCYVLMTTPRSPERKATLLLGYYLISVYPGMILEPKAC